MKTFVWIPLIVCLETTFGFNLIQLPKFPASLIKSAPPTEASSQPVSPIDSAQPTETSSQEASPTDSAEPSEETSEPLFHSGSSDNLQDFLLPSHLVRVNETQVVENLTSAETEMEELKALSEASVTLDAPSETEVAALTTTVEQYISAMAEVETIILDFEQSVLEFEASRPINPPIVASGLSDSDVASFTEMTSTLASISATMETMETLKDSVASKLDEMTSKMASLPTVMSAAEAEQLHPKLDALDIALENQSAQYETVLREFYKECDKVDQQVEMFPPSGNTGIVGEEKDLPVIDTTQSSVKMDYTANKAIDQQGYYWESWNSCSVTIEGAPGEAWWMAELGQVFGVSEVVIEPEYTTSISPLKVEGILQAYSDGTLYGRTTCFLNADIAPGVPFTKACDSVVLAKFIRLTITEQGSKLVLCEFKAKGYHNYSPYPSMDVTLSSTESSFDRASFSSDFQDSTCAMTKQGTLDPLPWLQIDMREQKMLKSIKLTNRADDYGSYMKDLKVLVYTELPSACGNTETTECAQYDGEHVGYGATIQLVCTNPAEGRYIRVIKTTVPPQPLSICEFQLEFEENN